MQIIRCITILLVLGSFSQADNDIYGSDGQYKGYVEKGGDVYGNDGAYKGYVEKSGDIYGADGSYKGEVDD
jgi:hypothetical protein